MLGTQIYRIHGRTFMKHRVIIAIYFLFFGSLIFTTKAFASESTLPSGIKDSEIGDIIEEYIEENKDTTASVSVAVFRGDETIYKTAYGYSNIRSGLKADDETAYEWGSVSKLLVWVSVMQLWEEEKIDLEADIKEYLPEGFFTKLKYDEPITMINLMNHNAGFEDVVFQMCAKGESEILSLEKALKVTEPNQIYEPGFVVSYSNWSTALAGYIVERISGQPFYKYVQEHIFKPLDMNHTGCEPTYSDNPWVKSKLLEAEGYTTELVPMEDGLFYINIYPAGSAAGTLDDFLKFAKALQSNSDGYIKLFKKKETLTEMLSPTLKYPDTKIDYINHGFWSHEFSVQALGHGGNTSMYSSYLLFDPVTGVGIVIMTNQGNEIVYNYGLPPIIFGDTGQMAHQEERSDTSEIEGLYYSARTIRKGIGKMYTILGIRPYLDDGQGNFNASFFGLAPITARQIAPNTFVTTQQIGSLEINSIGRYSNNNGTRKFSSTYVEILEADADIWALVITTILFIIAVLWSVVVLVISMIRFIIFKAKKRDNIHDCFKKYEFMLSIAILVFVINILSVADKMYSMKALSSSLTINIIVSIILAILPLGYAIQLFRKWKKLINGKLQKISESGMVLSEGSTKQASSINMCFM